MSYLLDTNTCIKYLNGQSLKIKYKLENSNPSEILLCSIVKAELLYGVEKSTRYQQNLLKLNNFMNRFISIPFDDSTIESYSKIRFKLEKAGILIGPNDLLIASIAVSKNVTLITHNTREFQRIENLQIEDWEI